MPVRITEPGKRQLQALATGLYDTVFAGEQHREQILGLLSHKLGKDFVEESIVVECFDKFGNNTGALKVDAHNINSAIANLPEGAESMVKPLKRIADWNEAISNKPLYASETRAQALKRVYNELENFMADHQSHFDDQQWRSLCHSLTGLRSGLVAIQKFSDEAKRLHSAITSSGVAIK